MWFLRLLSRLPLSILYILAFKVYILAYYIIGYRKKVVYQNLKNSFPEKSREELKHVQKKFYKHFSQLVVEILRGLSISKKEVRKRISLEGYEAAQQYFDNGQSVIALVGHVSNWEWMLSGWTAHSDIPIHPVYKKLSSAKFDKLMLDIRSRFGGLPVEVNDTGKRVIKRDKNAPQVFAFVADQIPPKGSICHWTTFLNQETAFFIGAEKLAKLGKIPVVYFDMERVKKGHYKMTVVPLAEPPYDNKSHIITDQYVKLLEQSIHRAPEQWLWSHRRWKRKRQVEN